MAGGGTNSLHKLLDPELRRQVERDLVEQPPGRETYEKVYEYYSLGDAGISFTAMARYGGYLRTLARNRWIGEVADAITGDDLGDNISGLIRSRLFEVLATGDCKIGDLLKASIAEKTLSERTMKVSEWEARRAEAIKAMEEKAQAGGGTLTVREAAELVDQYMRGEVA